MLGGPFSDPSGVGLLLGNRFDARQPAPGLAVCGLRLRHSVSFYNPKHGGANSAKPLVLRLGHAMAIVLSGHKLSGAAFDQCFLCGQDIAEADLSREHVFPKWLQRKFDLWNCTLDLLNGSSIPYRNLTIPACAACNNVSFSGIEDKIASTLPDGASAVRALGHEILIV